MGRPRNKDAWSRASATALGRRVLAGVRVSRGACPRAVVTPCFSLPRVLRPKGQPRLLETSHGETLSVDENVGGPADDYRELLGQRRLPPYQPPSCSRPLANEMPRLHVPASLAGGEYHNRVPLNHNFSPPVASPESPLAPNHEDISHLSILPLVPAPTYSPDPVGAYYGGGESLVLPRSKLEDLISPRKIVQVSFRGADGVAQNFTAMFSPDSDVSFATRDMITRLGENSYPWKKERVYHTVIGLLQSPQFSILKAQASEFGVTSWFPLHVAILEAPWVFADFCFGRTAMDQMKLQYSGFRKAIPDLCGYLSDLLDESPDDDVDKTIVKDMVTDETLSKSSVPMHQMHRIAAPLPQYSKQLATPPLSLSTPSESQCVMKGTSNPFTSSPAYPIRTPAPGQDWSSAFSPPPQHPISQPERRLESLAQLPPFHGMPGFDGDAHSTARVAVSLPHESSVVYSPINEFTVDEAFEDYQDMDTMSDLHSPHDDKPYC